MSGKIKTVINFELDDLLLKHFERDTIPSDICQYIRTIVKRLVDCGIDQINWRGMFGGKALYQSKVIEPFGGCYSLHSEIEAAFIAEVDPLLVVIDECRANDVSPWVWLDAFDCYIPGGHEAAFEQHPSWLLHAKDGVGVLPGVPCYANPDLRKYRLSLFQELSDYLVDGVCYSLFNSHATPFISPMLINNGQNPYTYGYNPEIVSAYKELYGKDVLREKFDIELWAKLQAAQFSEFLKMAKDLLNVREQRLDLVIRRDNHLAGSQYPMCYIANEYDLFYKMAGCDGLIVEGVTLKTWSETQNIIRSLTGPKWGIWHTLWASWSTGVPVEQTNQLVKQVVDAGNVEMVLLHEVDTIEFALQGGSRDDAYKRLGAWVKFLKS